MIIIGAGLSGIGAGCHLRRQSPWASFAILESRGAIGGTWDLFRYPGIRSDSDMYTFGYSFRPWTDPMDIAPAGAILKYLAETAREYDLARSIRFHHQLLRACWSSETNRWILDIRTGEGKAVRMSCNFLLGCTGYYDYDEGHLPNFEAMDTYRGQLIHPQHWPDDARTDGKSVLVIGSGATAMTLVPTLARTASHVTLLQRSPTYVFSRPARDPLAARLRRILPDRLTHRLVRWRNILLGSYFYRMARRQPRRVRGYLIKQVAAALGPQYDVATHFKPSYDPWDQRVCLVPDGDLFQALKSGRASVLTDRILRFTETGVALVSGAEIAADVIVTATGLKLKFLGGIAVEVDGRPVQSGELIRYKGVLFGNVPNFAAVFGYTNASWTLKADLSLDYVCALLNHMRAKGLARAMPVPAEGEEIDTALPLSSGYFQRAAEILPKQGKRGPWAMPTNYPADYLAMKTGRIDDGILRFA